MTSAWLHFPFLFFYLPNKLIVIWSVGLLSSCYSPARLAILRNLLFPSLVFSFLASHLDLVSRIGIGSDVLPTSFLRFSFVPPFSATLFKLQALLEIKRGCSGIFLHISSSSSPISQKNRKKFRSRSEGGMESYQGCRHFWTFSRPPPSYSLGGWLVLSNFFATELSVTRLNPEYQNALKYSNLATQGFNRGFVPI